jgi:transcriptional regulator with XRE-family HTH domain
VAPASSTVARWELARRLTARRKSLGIDHKTIARRLDFTRNYWSAVENERTLLSQEKLEEVIDLFEFDDEAADELRELRELGRSRGWWQAYGNSYDENGLRLIALEYGASQIREYESMAVPGLLQTEEYARTIIAVDPSMSQVDIEDAVDVRMRRQERLHDDDPVDLSVLVSEAALVQRWGSLDVHLAQLDHLLSLSSQENIQFRILPFEAPPGTIANSSTLVLYSFDSKYLPTVAFQEVVRLLDPVYQGDPDFRRLELCWNEGRRRAMSPEESRSRIESIVRDLT